MLYVVVLLLVCAIGRVLLPSPLVSPLRADTEPSQDRWNRMMRIPDVGTRTRPGAALPEPPSAGPPRWRSADASLRRGGIASTRTHRLDARISA